MSLAALDDWITVVDSDRPYALSLPDREIITAARQDAPVSETRIWLTSDEDGPQHWLGVCLPDRHRVIFNRTRIGRIRRILDWSLQFASRNIGASPGTKPGQLLYPLSFDGSPDERVYVIDGGNRRIQVFDLAGDYLTQWGSEGTNDGQFDFGLVISPEGMTGSIAVDAEGSIYVADGGNRRIQKFAP